MTRRALVVCLMVAGAPAGSAAQEPAASEEALSRYRAALEASPSDPWLRLEYADLLTSLRRFEEARRVAIPVADAADAPEDARVRALELVGTLAYWTGRLTEAVRRFEAALALEPGREAAARQLREIRTLTRPWLRLALEGLDDNQPYRRAAATVEAGVFLTPLWKAEVRVSPRALDPSGVPGLGTGARTVGEATAAFEGYLPDARLDVGAGFGGVLEEGASTWTGHAALALRLPGNARLEARADRQRYLWTAASADALVMMEGVELALDRADHPRWAGEAVLRRDAFPDGNGVRTAYGWLLAPVAPGLRLGGAASWQDADESRWSPALERYAPYFTPEEQRVASLLAELKASPGPATVRLNGSWGVWAREQAPLVPSSPPDHPPGRPAPTFAERSYTPWSVAAAVDAPAGDRLHLYLEAERSETAFYALTRGSLAMVLRLGRAGAR